MPTGIYKHRPLSEETKKKIGKSNSISQKGKKLSEETKRKISKNNSRFWLGKKLPQKIRKKISLGNSNKKRTKKVKQQISRTIKKSYKERKIKNWRSGLTKEKDKRVSLSEKTKRKIALKTFKGDNAGISAKHIWVKKIKLKPKFCEECGKEKKLELANIKNHQYTRNPNDYRWLCCKCHTKFDFPNGLIGKNLEK